MNLSFHQFPLSFCSIGSSKIRRFPLCTHICFTFSFSLFIWLLDNLSAQWDHVVSEILSSTPCKSKNKKKSFCWAFEGITQDIKNWCSKMLSIECYSISYLKYCKNVIFENLKFTYHLTWEYTFFLLLFTFLL